jgi:hypothetical protein
MARGRLCGSQVPGPFGRCAAAPIGTLRPRDRSVTNTNARRGFDGGSERGLCPSAMARRVTMRSPAATSGVGLIPPSTAGPPLLSP